MRAVCEFHDRYTRVRARAWPTFRDAPERVGLTALCVPLPGGGDSRAGLGQNENRPLKRKRERTALPGGCIIQRGATGVKATIPT